MKASDFFALPPSLVRFASFFPAEARPWDWIKRIGAALESVEFAASDLKIPAGVHIEERKGKKMKVRCTLPGYSDGHVELIFDGKTEVTICTMQRLPCVPGLKDPFKDCPE